MKVGGIIIKFNNVSKDFNINNIKTIVLNNINIHIEQSYIYGIVGNTGAGKSTILRLINGFIEADKGEIIIMNELLTDISKKN